MGKSVLRAFACDLVCLLLRWNCRLGCGTTLIMGHEVLAWMSYMRLSDMGGKALLVLAFGQSLGIMRLKEWRQILRRLVATLVSSYHRLDSTSSWNLIKSRGDISRLCRLFSRGWIGSSIDSVARISCFLLQRLLGDFVPW